MDLSLQLFGVLTVFEEKKTLRHDWFKAAGDLERLIVFNMFPFIKRKHFFGEFLRNGMELSAESEKILVWFVR